LGRFCDDWRIIENLSDNGLLLYKNYYFVIESILKFREKKILEWAQNGHKPSKTFEFIGLFEYCVESLPNRKTILMV
jgi:hypothetical protein